jgi:hypothetical protein
LQCNPKLNYGVRQIAPRRQNHSKVFVMIGILRLKAENFQIVLLSFWEPIELEK